MRKDDEMTLIDVEQLLKTAKNDEDTNREKFAYLKNLIEKSPKYELVEIKPGSETIKVIA